MACTVTSLFLIVMFGVIAAAGLVERAGPKGNSSARQNTRQDSSPGPSRAGGWARALSFPRAWRA